MKDDIYSYHQHPRRRKRRKRKRRRKKEKKKEKKRKRRKINSRRIIVEESTLKEGRIDTLKKKSFILIGGDVCNHPLIKNIRFHEQRLVEAVPDLQPEIQRMKEKKEDENSSHLLIFP